MKITSRTAKTVMFVALLLCTATTVYSQSSQYPYFMKHFWKETNETTRSLTNQFIENTELGKDYVERYNKIYKEADNLFTKKKSLESDYETNSNRAKRYKKQYNAANAMLAVVKVNYSLSRTNSNWQHMRNIANNLNNLAGKRNAAIDEMNSIHDKLDGISSKLYALDREAREFVPKVKKYFNDNMKNGTISSKKE